MDIRTISKNEIIPQLNKCYVDFDKNWQWGVRPNNTTVNDFCEYLLENAGLRMEVGIIEGEYTVSSYIVHKITLIDEQQYAMWLLKWS